MQTTDLPLLQFQPHHFAAGAIFLIAKFLKVKLPSHGEKLWWQEFDVTPRQLEEVSNQMLELYEQNRVPPLSEVEGATGSGATSQAAVKVPASNGENTTINSNSRTGVRSSRLETSKPVASKTGLGSSANHVEHPASNHGRSNDYGHTEMKHRVEDEAKGYGEEQETNVGRNEMEEAGENVKHSSRNPDDRDSTFGRPPQEVIKKIDRDKLKGTREKRTKASGYITKKTEVMDDDDLIERELEDGIELAAQSDKNKQDQGKTGLSPQLDQIMGMCCLEGTKIMWMSIIMG
ncbi:hypothetical protein K1719_010951 [Acacia pycnantha]|nr:hypothetical protein K1719_010951 [Acacia pycnantha]